MLSNESENEKELIEYSNSSLINNIINCDKYKLSELINTIIENNVNHIKTSINKTVEEQINSSINIFYKNDIDYEKELYNLTDKNNIQTHSITNYGNSKEIYKKFQEDNYDYFSINYVYDLGGNSGSTHTTLIFNKMNILKIEDKKKHIVINMIIYLHHKFYLL